jgi:hypothetical protein
VVTNQQLYLAIGVPMLFNAAMLGLFAIHANARFDAIVTSGAPNSAVSKKSSTRACATWKNGVRRRATPQPPLLYPWDSARA